MASVYVCDLVGNGVRPTPYRTEIGLLLAGTDQHVDTLMMDPATMKAMCLCTVDGLQGTGGIQLVFQAPGGYGALKAAAKATNITTQRRNAMNAWLTNNGYPTLPAGAQTFAQAVRTAARYVNGAADVDVTGVDIP